jgi:hypothetical protein
MLVVGKKRLEELRELREGFGVRVVSHHSEIGLPRNIKWFVKTSNGLGQQLGYFSVERRRKIDWKEIV